jgi:hypothetical protein
MRAGIYNLAIPETIWNSVNGASRPASVFFLQFSLLVFALATRVQAADWSGPEQQLARKVVAVTGPGAAALTFENRSSLSRRDTDIIQNGLRSAMEGLGLRFVKPEQSAATIKVALSENSSTYVWVAEIRQGSGEPAVVMVSSLRPEGSVASRDSVPLSLRKISLFAQENPILDVAVLEESAAPTHIAVLDSDNVTLYRVQNGKWEQEQAMGVVHNRPWPRDLRGRLIPAKDHLLDVYLPGVLCRTSGPPLTLSCRDSDDPWPLISGTLNGGALSVFPSAGLVNGASTVVPQMKAFFAPTRNFFTGVLTPALGKMGTVPKFYTAALLPREKYTLWLFSAVDGQLHMIDGASDQTAKFGWGSDIASVKTACGAGWQVLASSPGQGEDSVRAYEFPDRDPVGVSAAIDFPGPITALWTEARSDTAIAIARDRQTGNYEAFRLAVSCGQ